jgi:hypothetical protein
MKTMSFSFNHNLYGSHHVRAVETQDFASLYRVREKSAARDMAGIGLQRRRNLTVRIINNKWNDYQLINYKYMKNLILLFAMMLLPATGFAQSGTTGGAVPSTTGSDAVQTVTPAQAENPDVDYLRPSSGVYKICLSRQPAYLAESDQDPYSYGLGVPFLGLFRESELMLYAANAEFYVDAVGDGGQYVIVSGYEKTEQYLRGRFLFNTADSAWVNGEYNGPIRNPNYIWRNNYVRPAFMEAIRVGNLLYVPVSGQITDISQLEELAQAGTVRKIDLTADNRFTFAFRPLEKNALDFVIECPSGWEDFPGDIGWISLLNTVPMLSYIKESAEIFFFEPVTDPVPVLSVPSLSVGLAAGGILSVHTPAAEGIEVYSVGGQLLYRAQKPAGAATFDLSGLPRGVLIVHGTSGWTKKTYK